MILVDTNIISQLMRAEPSSLVLSWFGAQDPSALFLSAITEAELRTDVSILPMSQRRERPMVTLPPPPNPV
jgi:toxin FitB